MKCEKHGYEPAMGVEPHIDCDVCLEAECRRFGANAYIGPSSNFSMSIADHLARLRRERNEARENFSAAKDQAEHWRREAEDRAGAIQNLEACLNERTAERNEARQAEGVLQDEVERLRQRWSDIAQEGYWYRVAVAHEAEVDRLTKQVETLTAERDAWRTSYITERDGWRTSYITERDGWRTSYITERDGWRTSYMERSAQCNRLEKELHAASAKLRAGCTDCNEKAYEQQYHKATAELRDERAARLKLERQATRLHVALTDVQAHLTDAATRLAGVEGGGG